VSEDERRYSFETVAETYERGRPPYGDEAIAWIAERLGIGPGRRVLDLAAGTGKVARQLLPLGAEVVAVEPGDQMRGVAKVRTLLGAGPVDVSIVTDVVVADRV
jgi:ubiquinone/menaquinone biosynthesis C-methylase UbiE